VAVGEGTKEVVVEGGERLRGRETTGQAHELKEMKNTAAVAHQAQVAAEKA
jgi:hypothetical protein